MGVGDLLIRRDGDRIADHAALEFFDFLDFRRLSPNRKIAVDDAEPALLGHGDGDLGFGHRVHRRAHQRDTERDAIGQAGRNIDIFRQHRRLGGNQQNIVES